MRMEARLDVCNGKADAHSFVVARRLAAGGPRHDGFGKKKKTGRADMWGLGKRLPIFPVLSLPSPRSFAFAETADTVLFNGKILTVEGFFGPAGAGDRARPGKSDRC